MFLMLHSQALVTRVLVYDIQWVTPPPAPTDPPKEAGRCHLEVQGKVRCDGLFVTCPLPGMPRPPADKMLKMMELSAVVVDT